MKRTSMVFSLAFALAFAASAQAADTNESVIIDNGFGNTNKAEQKGDYNDAFIIQNSNNNDATIVQGSKKSESDKNFALIEQGDQEDGGAGGNEAFIEQKGDGSLALISQIPTGSSSGGGNVARIKQSNFSFVTDNSHEAMILQSGAYNNAEIEQKNGQGNRASILQVGDGAVKAKIDQKGSNNQAQIIQCDAENCTPGGGPIRHSAEINQGDGKSTATGNRAAIYQQGSWVDLDLVVQGHTAKIDQEGFNNWAGIAQTQTGVEDHAFINQDGTGNGAIAIQGSDPGIQAILSAGPSFVD